MRYFLLPLACLLVTPALAVEAVTYKGTLGNSAIVLELTDPAARPVVGRYSYMKVGGDIPLQAGHARTGISLIEEAPCAPGLCAADADTVTNPPIGGSWDLTETADGLTGTWTSAKDGKVLPIVLERLDSRTLPEGTELTPAGLRDSATELTYGPALNPLEGLPYDNFKMGVVYDEGPIETIEGSQFRYVSDPRTKFAFPRIVELADGSSTNLINEALIGEHNRTNFYAFDCLATAYAGFGATDRMLNSSTGTLGNFDQEQVTLSYLTPTVVNWIQSGSTFCGSAYPNNHADISIFDVKTGEPLDLSAILSGWVPRAYGENTPADPATARAHPDDYFWGPDAALVDWVRANRVPDADAQFEAECGIDELIADNLAVRFVPGDKVVFSLAGLPHVMFACTTDLVTVDLAAIPELLAPGADAYFPSLRQ